MARFSWRHMLPGSCRDSSTMRSKSLSPRPRGSSGSTIHGRGVARDASSTSWRIEYSTSVKVKTDWIWTMRMKGGNQYGNFLWNTTDAIVWHWRTNFFFFIDYYSMAHTAWSQTQTYTKIQWGQKHMQKGGTTAIDTLTRRNISEHTAQTAQHWWSDPERICRYIPIHGSPVQNA